MTTNKDIVEYEEVVAEHPITHQLETVRIEKPVERTPEEAEAHVRAELKQYGLVPIQKVELEDPITGEKRMITLDRQGHTEAKLILALADPNLTRDRKDFEVSMYLYERGKQNTSMMVDLMRYKGAHTKETRVFKSQIRFDFEQLVQMLASHMKEQALRTAGLLGIDLPVESSGFKEWLTWEENKDNHDLTYKDYALDGMKDRGEEGDLVVRCALISEAIFAYDEAVRLLAQRRKMSEAREQDKGKGIYMSRDGRPYTHDDPFMDEAIEEDRKATEEAGKDI